MDPVRAQRDRRPDIVVHDERDAELPEASARFDQLLGRRALDPQLDDGRTRGDRRPRSLEVGDDRVHPHAICALRSSVSGSRAASAS